MQERGPYTIQARAVASQPYYGAMTVLLSSMTAVCASSRPLIDAPVHRLIAVWVSTTAMYRETGAGKEPVAPA